MRDPHVEALYYRLETGQQLAFSNPPPTERETNAFSLRLADGKVEVKMKDHYTTDAEARRVVEPYLRSWEIATTLQHGPGTMTFVFERADVVDRNPPPPGASVAIHISSGGLVTTGCSAITRLSQAKYPDPPDRFVASPDVVTMWQRYEGYWAGREPLASMAYMCLTVFNASAGGPHKAARQYSIDPEVLKQLGHLTSAIGDALTARKVGRKHQFRPHTSAEITWIEAVVKVLIQRAGEWAANPNATRPKIALKDFPTI